MTETMDHTEARISLGVYVLGAIDPAERALVDAHLTTCSECRDELAGLAGLPALLARVNTEEATALAVDEPPGHGAGDSAAGQAPALDAEPPRELLGTVLDLAAARRRRRNWRAGIMSAAAAVIIAAAAFGGARLAGGSTTPTQTASGPVFNYGTALGSWETDTGHLHATNGKTLTAIVQYLPMMWGTRLNVKVEGIPPGTLCTISAVEKTTGKSYSAGSWTTDTQVGKVWYTGGTGLMSSGVKQFRVTVAGQPRPIVVSTT